MSEIEDPAVEPDAGAAEETPAEEAARVYAGKFNTDDDLERGYQELEKSHTQTRQEAAELRAQIEAYEAAQQQEEPFDPYSLGGILDEESEQAWVRNLYRDPAGTMEKAIKPESVQAYGPELADRLYLTWFGQQPLQAGNWNAKHSAQEQRAELEQMQQRFDQVQAERQQENNLKQSQIAKQLIDTNLPDFGQYRDRVIELFDSFSIPDEDPRMASPEAMAEFTRQMYQIARGEEFDRQQAQAAQEATTEKPAPGAKARTQTRSTAAAGSATQDPAMAAYYAALAQTR